MPKFTDYTETTGSVARRFGVDTGTVARWARKGALPSVVSPGGWRLFRTVDVDAFEAKLLKDGAT